MELLLAVVVLLPLLGVRRGWMRAPLWALWGGSELAMGAEGWSALAVTLGTLVLADSLVERQLEQSGWAALSIAGFGVAAVMLPHPTAFLVVAMLFPLRLAMLESGRIRILVAWGCWAACGAVLVQQHGLLVALLAAGVLGIPSVRRQLESVDALWMPFAWMLALTVVAVPARQGGLLLFWLLFPLQCRGVVLEGRILWGLWLAAVYGLAETAGVPLALMAAPVVLAARAVQRQVELSSTRRDFASMVSHELRTPIAALRLHAEMLENHLITNPSEVEACHHEIAEQTRRLQHLTESILDISRVERGAKVFNCVETSLNDVVTDAVKEMPGEVVLKLETGLPMARADREAATRVIVNLLQNAQRYARDISVATASDRHWVTVLVLDRGPGIPREKRGRLFEPFVRGQQGGQGLGLGLALVRRYMHGQQGRVSIQDRRGGGCEVKVQFRR